jgi:hypothetical protein
MFDSEGETSKLYQQDYISQNTIPKKNFIYPEIKSLFTVSTVLGIIGSLICIIAVFLPFYDKGHGIARTVISGDNTIIPTEYYYKAHNVLYFPFFGKAVLITAILSLLVCIFIKRDYGIIRYFLCGIICILNLMIGISKLGSVYRLRIGHLLLYIGAAIISISTYIMFYATIKNNKLKRGGTLYG